MARRKQRTEASAPVTQSVLPPAYPSSPTRPGTHVVVAKKEDRYCCLIFSARYAAKAFVEAVTDGEGQYQFKRSHTVGPLQAHFESGLIIQVEPAVQLEDLVEGPPRQGPELEFEVSGVHLGQVLIIKHGRRIQEDAPEPKRREKREAAVRTPRAQKTGKGPNDFAEHLKTEPGKVRQALRKIMPKPDGGWDFSDDDFQALLPKVKAALK